MFARDLMTAPVVTIRENATVSQAARLMLDKDVSALPVLNEDGRIVGILTHADFGLSPKFRPLMDNVYNLLGATTTTRHLEETSRKVGGKLVRDVMRRNVLTASQDAEIEQVAHLMLRAQIHRLPIVDNGRLVGIITRHDFLKLIASEE